MHLLFIGDAKRDAVTVPRLVERILGVSVNEETRDWPRLHEAKDGIHRKLKYMIRLAQDRRVQGLVATLDHDKEKKRRARLHAMQEVRENERTQGNQLPMALGKAIPHGEAWLLDDRVAVREALGLPADAQIPTVRKAKDPKKALEQLLADSKRADGLPRAVWPDIARNVDPKRCAHSKLTGFKAFADDVRSELGPLATRSGAA